MKDSTFAAVILFLAAPFFAAAQHAKDTPKPNVAEVRFADGSLVRMTILPDTIAVQTRYGKLTVPVRDIRKIDFGLHIPPVAAREIADALTLLGSDKYAEREAATKNILHHGPLGYLAMKRASASVDQETAKRAAVIVRKLEETFPAESLRTREEDIVLTTQFTIVGRVLGTLKANSVTFGEIDLRLPDLRAMFVRSHSSEVEVKVDAVAHGFDQNKWLDTGIVLMPGERLKITAEGQVDLWPQDAGKYVCGPKGYSTAGRGAVHMAGTLLGRLGEDGKAFVVGERFEGAPGDGKVWLQIVPNPWNGPSEGQYTVKVATEYVGGR